MEKGGEQKKKARFVRKEIDEILSGKHPFGGTIKVDDNGRIIIPPNERLQRTLLRIVSPLDSEEGKKSTHESS